MTENHDGHKPEVNFLPPLKMVLTFFDRHARERTSGAPAMEVQQESDQKTVAKLIEKLSEKDA